MSEHTLKPGWNIWRFDQMAISVNDRIDNPAEAEEAYYVGLEHLDADSLKIRRWGVPSDVEATKLRFRKGDIIFGRRRVYQRKVAVAEFDGICSAHALVLRAKPDVVLPEFLPFFMQSDLFMTRALEISVGSLSPTINWKTLASQEFALPPLEEQRRITTLFISIEEFITQLHDVISSAIITESAFLRDLFGFYFDKSERWKRIELNQVAYIQTGAAKGRQAEPGVTADIPYIGVSNVQDGFLDLTEIKTITLPTSKVGQYQLQIGDLLMTEGGDPDKLGRGTVWQGEIEGSIIHQNHIFAVRSDIKKLQPWFLAAVTRSIYAKQYFLSCSKRTSNLASINKKQVGNFLLPLPDKVEQEKIITEWKTIRNAYEHAQCHLRKIQLIRAKILSSLWEGTV